MGEEIFLEMYRDVDVVVDQPACTLWHILLRQFPGAKVILMERESAEAWHRSYLAMCRDYVRHNKPRLYPLLPLLSSTHSKLDRLARCN